MQSSWGPLYKRDWEPVTSTLQALSLVEKVEPVNFASHYAWGTIGVCKCKWIMFHGHLDYFQKPPLGDRPNTKPLGDNGTPNAHDHWFILFCHVWGPTWIEIHSNSIWLRALSHMGSHYTRGSVTTLLDFGGVFGRPLDTLFWDLTISCSHLLARVWCSPKGPSHTRDWRSMIVAS